MENYVNRILELNVEKKALNILSAVQSLERSFTLEELETVAEMMLSIASSAPTFSMLKTVLQRNWKRAKSELNDNLIKDQTESHYGFVRGAEFGNSKESMKKIQLITDALDNEPPSLIVLTLKCASI